MEIKRYRWYGKTQSSYRNGIYEYEDFEGYPVGEWCKYEDAVEIFNQNDRLYGELAEKITKITELKEKLKIAEGALEKILSYSICPAMTYEEYIFATGKIAHEALEKIKER